MADPDARRRAEEALVFMNAALSDDMPPLPSQVKALADAVRALLAAGPEAPPPPSDAVREAAEALTVYCDVCEVDRRQPCVTVTTGDPAPYPHPERAVAAKLAARGGE